MAGLQTAKGLTGLELDEIFHIRNSTMVNDEQISLFDLTESGAAPSSSQNSASPIAATFDPALIPTSAQVSIPTGTYSSMEQMAAHCNRCDRCELGQNRTHAVIGRGHLQAPIMIVGEGPGQTEDETGLPFTGKSGQLLDKILASVELTTERDVFICNVVKCRPPENRTPTTDEAMACKGYLMEQIRMVNPKIILLTGATALKNLVGIKQGITKVRGQWLDRDGRWYLPIFHPAYLLRNPSREQGSPKWLMWQDIQAVRTKLDALSSD